MPRDRSQVLQALHNLRQSVHDEAASRIDHWQPYIERASYAASAINLAHYLAFRHHDLRDLQRELMRHGLSSLGRLESRVTLTLETVEATLAAAVQGKAAPAGWPPSAKAFFAGETQLRENTSTLLG